MISKFYSMFKFLLFLWTTSCLVFRESSAQQTSDGSTNGKILGQSSFFFYQQSTYPRDCREVQGQCSSHNSSGVFMIKPDGYPDPFEVYCDNTDSSGGWTVIQRRIDGSIDFRRDWDSYKSGFGFLSHEFWLGNEKLSLLTNQKKYQLVIEITTSEGYFIRVSYDHFRISDAFSHFKLVKLGNYSGENTDAITFCPSNMDIDNCSTACQRTCEAPGICQDEVCTDGEVCFCPDGFFMKGSDCVPPKQCGCYVSEGKTIVPEGDFFVNAGCTRKGVCTNGEIIWDEGYACSPNANCEEINNIRQCYCDDGYGGDGETCTSVTPKDCQEIYDDDNTRNNGIYRIKPTGWTGSAFEVYCNMTDGGGWTVFQRRVDGSQDFYLGWNSYKQGFGNLNINFWLGNDKLYFLTNQKRYEIRIDLVNRYGAPYYAKFDFFRTNVESDNYRLSGLGTYSGTAGDSLSYHRNQQFTTKDRDNDAYSYNCATYYSGAWWYNACNIYSNLNGVYENYYYRWYYIPGSNNYLKFSEMKIRPI
ncbi:techylectin-5B-like [Apostichopus japonicus]|uniref:techylectin-5B-like n=1 Tax=Stichopus japonicus TaxID=307972 RepID=UPI003AB38E6B